MITQVFGLCFFALLLESVNGVNNVMGEASMASNSAKDGIVQFLRIHDGAGKHSLPHDLIKNCVAFVNFYFSSGPGLRRAQGGIDQSIDPPALLS
jgi:hypothetical protein